MGGRSPQNGACACFAASPRNLFRRIDKFEEISTTLNASRDGLYFSTDIRTYKVGMSLVVTFPYSHAPERNVHFFRKVVRIDVLPEGHFGIAVELVMTIANKQKLRAVAETVRR